MMLTTKENRHGAAQFLFVMLLFLSFAGIALGVLAIGGNIYDTILQKTDDNYALRTPLSYLATKVRQAESKDQVFVQEFADGSALVLEETIDGQTYQNWVYYYQNALWEITIAAGFPFSPSDGMQILPVHDLQIQMPDNNTLQFTSQTANGQKAQLCLTLMGGSK